MLVGQILFGERLIDLLPGQGHLGAYEHAVEVGNEQIPWSSVLEFVRNNIFDARNSFTDFCTVGRCRWTPGTTPAPPDTIRRTSLAQTWVDHILKDKFFFQAAYEGWRYSKPSLTTTLVPTSQELSGDFSSSAWSYYQHKFYNPYSTVCTGGKCTVQQFQCDATGIRWRHRTTYSLQGRHA